MTDEEIKLHLIAVAAKSYSVEDLQKLTKNLTDPMFDFFYSEKDFAKMYLVAQIIEDQCIKVVKDKIIKGYRHINSNPKDKGIH